MTLDISKAAGEIGFIRKTMRTGSISLLSHCRTEACALVRLGKKDLRFAYARLPVVIVRF
jgi:hypothetical protein